MPIITDGPTMAPEDKGISEFHTGRAESLGATAMDTLADVPIRSLYNALSKPIADDNFAPSQTDALGNIVPNGPGIAEEAKPATPPVDIIDANDRVKKAGLAPFLKLPDQPDIPPAQLEIMMTRAQQRREREATMERGPQDFVQSALSVGTSFLVGAVDPVNVAAAFIPVMGEMRYGKMLADAGGSAVSRFAVRASVGAAQGAVGQAALEPLDWWQHTQDGRDFGMADVLHNVMFGAALGGTLHSGGGLVSDVIRRRQGRALYPFGPGEPMENVQGTHLPAALLHEDGITPEALEQHFGAETPEIAAELATPQRVPLRDPVVEPESIGQSIEATAASDMTPSPEVQTINDLPARAHEDAMRGAIASLIEGEPVRAGEMLEAAAQTDPRIAESFEAFHGSPHDFDRFDIDRIGSGEGAQAYGHGLYFAESEKVARGYQRRTSDKAFVDKVAQLYDEHFSPDEAWDEIKQHWSDFTPAEQRLMEALQKDDWLGFDYPHHAVSEALSPRAAERYEMSSETVSAARAMGNMYRVKISADHDHFLDWDKPLSEQSEFVRNAVAKVRADLENRIDQRLAEERADLDYARKMSLDDEIRTIDARIEALEARKAGLGDAKGSELYRDMSTSPGNRAGGAAMLLNDASRMLHEAGIPGIKYLDQGSRRAGEGTRNFVVFNDKDIDITHKNGEPVQREEFLAQRAQDRAAIAGDIASGENPAAAAARPVAAADTLDRDAAWHALAQRTPDFDDPNLIAASKEADSVRPPPTKLDDRVAAAEKANAFAKQMYDMFADRLPPEDRQRLDDLLKKIDDDHEAREIAIVRGGSCLFGVV